MLPYTYMLTFLTSNQYRPFVRDVFRNAKITAQPLKSGLLNQNIRLDAKGQSFVLKIYRPEVNSKKLAQTHRLLSFAHKHGIPVALSIASKEIDGHQTAMYPFLTGEHPPRLRNSQKNLFAMGEMLGRIHKSLEKFSPKESGEVVGELSREKIMAGFQEIDKLLRVASKTDRAFLQPMVRFQKTAFSRDRFDYGKQKKLPVFFCHGDFHFANILMDRGVVTGVLDWEKAGWMWRSQELMRSLLFNTRISIGEFNLGGIKTFISGYKRQISLTPLEKELMFDIGFRKYAYDFWAMRQFLAGQHAFRSNIKRRFEGTKTLARHREMYKQKIGEFLN